MFLPGFTYTEIPAANYGYQNYVWTIYPETAGAFGTFAASEPFINSHNTIPLWIPESIGFHWPAEHVVNNDKTLEAANVTYDLEMQI